MAAHRDKLYALDSATLEPRNARWTFPTDEGDDDIDVVALYGTPAVTSDAVFVPAYDGTLYALDRETGAVLWSYETDGALIGGVAVFDDTVYFGSSDGNVYALDAASGDPRWRDQKGEPGWFKTGNEVWSTPAVLGDTLFVTSLDSRVYALDAASGVERWSVATEAGIASPPVVDEETGLVYVGGFDSQLRGIEAESGEERWSVEAENWFWTEPLVVDGVVYAGSLDGRVYAVDAATGEGEWALPFVVKGAIRSAPVVAEGVLVVVDKEGRVYSIDRADGGSAVSGSPLELEAGVLADPVVVPGTEEEGRGGKEDVMVVTTGGDLVRIDAATLRVVGVPRSLKD